MLFVCCDEMIPIESRLVLALKTLCGFDVREIGHRLFISEENAYKRLGRARARLRQISDFGVDLSSRRTVQRLPAVHQILYLLFTEGYLSTHAESAVRRELCDEACRLTTLLSEHPIGQTPETFALLALMHLHLARMGGRQDSAGGLLLLEEQDRSLWDVGEVARGLRYLAESATGDRFSRYHAEAAVAAEHCLAPSFAETRWDRVAESYSLLEQVAPSAIHRLNRAIAVAEWKGAESGLLVLENFEPPPWLRKSYLWAAALADLHARCRDQALAAFHREAALRLAPNAAIRELLERRLCGATSERQR
jgi:RNA polymerase sigma-70 factor (ECF subfamily)